ncbi:putative surface protease GP63 [Trypanosoma cruzi]|uniref:Leishmanolysin-like peptidase n=2 Tax=Trypanosoma cruzi TaxID=5693 RepID=Q4E1S2_TRYCC|nr:surface protease GP63, putative [Trypanosoma cruzi]EAN98730.1 surface protease GP63, putative [Trypanosoma cruzi]PWV06239.1 putative surface protease GP63 [Trypanosoma cruzi]RNC45540.1 putative surface protease GP63 [Trypanosoma cruzi]|eukprot:XP_820581.1 surface protease GP63 [Trypanosoma cruzi strain CL Brener]
MRRPLFTTIITLFLLQLLGCSIGCLALSPTAHHCMYDEIMKKASLPKPTMVRELPRKGRGTWQTYTASTEEDDSGVWAPIRIMVSEKDLNDPSKYCTNIGEPRPTFLGFDKECQLHDILTSRTRAELLQNIFPAAIKLHSDRLSVRPNSSPLIVPRSIKESHCKHFTVPEEHYTTGVENADAVIYLAAGTHFPFAVSCLAAEKDVRPTVGAMSFSISGLHHSWFAVRVIAHELAHVLGFNYEQMRAQNMLSSISTNSFQQKKGIVTSVLTKQKAVEHYNCESLEGMPMRDEHGDNLRMHSHWDQRYAKDDLMSSMVTSGAGFYTAVTMAAFADMGFFKVNFSMAETMNWGKGVGCNFVNQKQCMPDDYKNYPEMFCHRNTSDTRRYCTSDRVQLGICSSFSDDQCLFIQPMGFGSCRDTTSILHGSRMGTSSWCLDGESLKVNEEVLETEPQVISVGGVCVEVFCGRKEVSVRYLGDDDWHECPEGGKIFPANTSVDFAEGYIKCPRYEDVCTITPSGRSGIPFQENGPIHDDSSNRK